MRRIVLSLAVALSAALTACSQGGQVLGTGGNDAERVILSVAGQINVARVNAGDKIIISAQDVRGEANGAIYNNSFTWRAQLATGTSSYPTTAFGPSGTQKACATATLAGSTYTPDFTPFLTVAAANPANVTFTPPAQVPGSPTFTPPLTSNAYCVIVTATSSNNVNGTIVVAITNPALPQL
jgi:hypothetical protein